MMFWAAAAIAVTFALMPAAPAPISNDKVQHIAAFAVLAALASLAYPQARKLTIFLALAVLGGAIELIQGTKLIGRDADFVDWYSDMAAVGVVLFIATKLHGSGKRRPA